MGVFFPYPESKSCWPKARPKQAMPKIFRGLTVLFLWGPLGNLGASEAAHQSLSLVNEGGPAGPSPLPPPGPALSLRSLSHLSLPPTLQLLHTSEDVAKMQEELEIMRPLLEEAAKDTTITMEQIKVGVLRGPLPDC